MTTERQADANWENAKKNMGPRPQAGKRRSRRNAIRLGLNAETVVDVFGNMATTKRWQQQSTATFARRLILSCS